MRALQSTGKSKTFFTWHYALVKNSLQFAKIFLLTKESKNLINPTFIEFFKDKFNSIEFTYNHDGFKNILKLLLPPTANLYGAILFTWYWMHVKNTLSVIQHSEGDVYEPISKNYEELKKFAETIRMIK